jgi:cytochrome P450
MSVEPKPAKIIDYDHHSRQYAQTWPEVTMRNSAECPVAKSEAYGGFWLLSGYSALTRAARDTATFTTRHVIGDDNSPYGGITIPARDVLVVPEELDPPELLDYRKILNKLFGPQMIDTWRPFITEVVGGCIDEFCETGQTDLILALANPAPAIVTLKMVGLPLHQWRDYAMPLHEHIYAAPGSALAKQSYEAIVRILEHLRELVPRRRADPKDDLLSTLASATINGEPISDSRVVDIAILVLLGGVDTTTTLIGNALHWLHQHPEARASLAADRSLIKPATEEFLRFFTPAQHVARTVTADVDVDGYKLQAEDRVLLSLVAANRDEKVFPNAGEVQLDRFPNRHLAFGFGPHRCLGLHLARAEFEIVLEAVLDRFPDYVIDEENSERYPTAGHVPGWITLPCSFSPSDSLGLPNQSPCA